MSSIRPLSWLAVLAVVFGGWGAAPATAAAPGLGVPLAVCFAPDTATTTARQVLGGGGRGFDCQRPQAQFGSGDFWAVSGRLSSELPRETVLAVRSASTWHRAVTLYALYPDGAIVATRMDDTSAARQLQLGAILEQRLPPRATAPVRLAWRIEGASNLRGILVAPTIMTPEAVATANVGLAALYAGFAGILFALLVHDVALWRALRQRYHLWHALLLVGTLAYTCGLSGVFSWLLPGIANTLRMRFNGVAFALSGIAMIGFVRSLFGPRVFAGWLDRYAIAAGAASAAATTLFTLVSPWHARELDTIFLATNLAVMSLIVPVMLRIWHEEWRIWVFALAWATPLITILLRMTHALERIGPPLLVSNANVVALCVQAIGAALPLAQRIRQLAQERDEARAQELAARLLADTDPLTGLLNRRAFLAQAIGRSEPQRLLVLDLDHFKRVNDTIGHDGGDEVLRRVARILRGACPGGGLAARLGGEEFAVLVPLDDALDPNALLAQLRAARMPFDLAVTASIGACAGRVDTEASWKQLYRAADRALFQAKAAGRDRSRSLEALPALAA